MAYYSYYMTQRPAMPGAQPSKGLIDVEDAPKVPWLDRVYSKITYDRELSIKEVQDYELTPAQVREEDYKGYRLIFVGGIWYIRDEGTKEILAEAYTYADAVAMIDSL